MTGTSAVTLAGTECFVTRSGYTGEDGYEISAPAESVPMRSHVRCSRCPMSSRPAWGHATRCDSKPVSAFTAMTSPRNHDPRSKPA